MKTTVMYLLYYLTRNMFIILVLTTTFLYNFKSNIWYTLSMKHCKVERDIHCLIA